MRIWILNHYAIPPDRPGGTRHYDLATELVGLGCQVTIFASSFNHRTRREGNPQEGRGGQTQVIDGVRFVWIRTCSYRENNWRRAVNMTSYGLSVALLGFGFKPRPDVILASSPHPFAGLAGYALATARHTRFVFEVRDLWPQTLVDVGGYSPRSPLVRVLRVLERFLYRRADKIVVLLPMASDYITGLGIPARKIAHIPNGAHPRLCHNSDTTLPVELIQQLSQLRSSGRFVVGYVGAHGRANALETIVEAGRLLRDRGIEQVFFVLVGDGPEKARLMASAESHGLENIAFVDSIPKDLVPGFLNRVDTGIISMRKTPLYKHGLSLNKLWDYMMCSKPVVWASDAANDPVAEAQCGLTVPPEEPDRLADAVAEMCRMPEEERREMGMRGHEYVMKYHSTPALAARLLEVLQEVTNQ